MNRYQIYEGEKTTVKQVREGQRFVLTYPNGDTAHFIMGAKREATCTHCTGPQLEAGQKYKLRPRTFITL